jgi:hypothetical protein
VTASSEKIATGKEDRADFPGATASSLEEQEQPAGVSVKLVEADNSIVQDSSWVLDTTQPVRVEIQIENLNFVKINTGSLADMASQNFMECSGGCNIICQKDIRTS